MKVINNVLHQSFTNHPEFGILKGVKVFITGTNIAGPFAGSIVTIKSIDNDKRRIKVSLVFGGKESEVDMDAKDVEAID